MARQILTQDKQWRATAVWFESTTGAIVNKTTVGPYSKPGTAKGALTGEIKWLLDRWEKQVESGEYIFDRWLEEAVLNWKKV